MVSGIIFVYYSDRCIGERSLDMPLAIMELNFTLLVSSLLTLIVEMVVSIENLSNQLINRSNLL